MRVAVTPLAPASFDSRSRVASDRHVDHSRRGRTFLRRVQARASPSYSQSQAGSVDAAPRAQTSHREHTGPSAILRAIADSGVGSRLARGRGGASRPRKQRALRAKLAAWRMMRAEAGHRAGRLASRLLVRSLMVARAQWRFL
jgi:hypothetical protein